MEARFFELALEALEHKKVEIEKEISEIQAELKGGLTGSQVKLSRSERMKVYWAAKRAGSAMIAKPKVARKRRQMTAAEKEALSRKLKVAWARRKAKP